MTTGRNVRMRLRLLPLDGVPCLSEVGPTAVSKSNNAPLFSFYVRYLDSWAQNRQRRADPWGISQVCDLRLRWWQS
jgi:hypothetical protein